MLGVVVAVGSALDAAPPCFVVFVPVDGVGKGLWPGAAGGFPVEFSQGFGAVDGVAAVVTGAVGDGLDGVVAFAHEAQDFVGEFEVAAFVVEVVAYVLGGDDVAV